jgi:thioredoxin-related protein
MYKIFLVFLFSAALFGSELEWMHNYKEAQKLALKENKAVLLLITTEGCRWCRKLESTTLRDDDVIANISADFIPVHLTRGKDSYPSTLKAKRVPASFFLYSDGRPIMRSVMGYWSAEDYLSILEDAKRKIRKTGDSKQ